MSTGKPSCSISAVRLWAFAPWALPAPGRPAPGIELDVMVGYGDAAVDVPEPLRQAIRLLIAHWYENRGLVSGGARQCCRRTSRR